MKLQTHDMFNETSNIVDLDEDIYIVRQLRGGRGDVCDKSTIFCMGYGMVHVL